MACNSNRLSATESLILDSEITDVLFHFDAIMDALEEDIHELSISPREVSPSSGTTQSQPSSPTHNESTKLSSHLTSSRANLPNVRELQKQFLLSKGINIVKTASQSKHIDVSQVRVNVQNIIQQLHGKASSTSPEPLSSGTHRPRSNSKSIMDKISVLTTGHQTEAFGETRRSYTPPLKRSKIKSPFLERSKSEDFDSILSEAIKQDSSHPLTIPESFSPTPPPLIEPVLDTVFDNEENTVTEQPSEIATTEVPYSVMNDNHEQSTKGKETVSKPSSVKESPQDSPQKCEDRPTLSASPDKVFVTIREDYKKNQSSQTSKSDLKSHDEKSKPKHKANSDTKQNPVTEADRKRSAVIGLDDVLISLDSELTIEEEPESILNKSTDGNHVELIIGVRENGLFEAPPRIVDPIVTSSLELPPKKTNHYDKLLSKNHYDHLPPVDDEDQESETETFPFRYRSVSDVTAQRVHPVATPPSDSNHSSTVYYTF